MHTLSTFLTSFLEAAQERGVVHHRWWPQVARWAGEVVDALSSDFEGPNDLAKKVNNFLFELDRADFTASKRIRTCEVSAAELLQAIEAARLADRPFTYDLETSAPTVA